MASICELCGKRVMATLIPVGEGDEQKAVCKQCYERVINDDCYKCGEKGIQLGYKCARCCQVDAYKQVKNNNEMRMSLGGLQTNSKMSEQEFNDWLTMSPVFNFSDFENDPTLQKLYVKVKLLCVGIADDSIIDKYYDDIIKLLLDNKHIIQDQSCRVVIAYTPELVKLVRSYSGEGILAGYNNIYLFSVNNLCDDDDYSDDGIGDSDDK